MHAQVLSVAKDQNGCRFLQRKFDEGGAASIAMVFPEVLDNLIELMVDPFGNYLIQKLLDRCSEEQRLQVNSTPPLAPSPFSCSSLTLQQHLGPIAHISDSATSFDLMVGSSLNCL